MKRVLIGIFALAFSVSLTACNTVKGFGKEVERGGEKVQETSDNVRK